MFQYKRSSSIVGEIDPGPAMQQRAAMEREKKLKRERIRMQFF